jgi:type II secretory pathway pseudopilin PulG
MRETKAVSRVPGGGFTLIELLTITAIISVLLALLLPGLNYARCQAKRVACRANLRQLAQAWQMYLDNNGGRFYQGINANVTYGGWRGRNPAFRKALRPLNRYACGDVNDAPESPSGAEVCKCPSDDGGLIGQGVPCYDLFGTSYQTNVLLVGQDQKGWLPDATLLAEINRNLKGLWLGQ